VATEIGGAATGLIGRAMALGGPPGVRQFWSGPRRRRFPKRWLELCRADRGRLDGEMQSAAASIRAWWPATGGPFPARRPASGSTRNLARIRGERGLPGTGFCPGVCPFSRRRHGLMAQAALSVPVLMTPAACSLGAATAMAIFPMDLGAAQAPWMASGTSVRPQRRSDERPDLAGLEADPQGLAGFGPDWGSRPKHGRPGDGWSEDPGTLPEHHTGKACRRATTSTLSAAEVSAGRTCARGHLGRVSRIR